MRWTWIVIDHTYPVLQASLNILTESAVITKASAQARCPICGFGPKCNEEEFTSSNLQYQNW